MADNRPHLLRLFDPSLTVAVMGELERLRATYPGSNDGELLLLIIHDMAMGTLTIAPLGIPDKEKQ